MISTIIQECAQCLISKEEGVTNLAQECLESSRMRGFLNHVWGGKMSRSRPDGKEDKAFQAFFKTFHNIYTLGFHTPTSSILTSGCPVSLQ